MHTIRRNLRWRDHWHQWWQHNHHIPSHFITNLVLTRSTRSLLPLSSELWPGKHCEPFDVPGCAQRLQYTHVAAGWVAGRAGQTRRATAHGAGPSHPRHTWWVTGGVQGVERCWSRNTTQSCHHVLLETMAAMLVKQENCCMWLQVIHFQVVFRMWTSFWEIITVAYLRDESNRISAEWKYCNLSK